MSRKVHLQSIRRYSAICPPVLVALVDETGQSAHVRTRKGRYLRFITAASKSSAFFEVSSMSSVLYCQEERN